MIVDAQEIDVDEIEQISPDNTIGGVHSDEPFPERTLFDLNRVQAAIAEYRNRFGDKTANIGIYENEDGLKHLALWPATLSFEAVVVCERVRENSGDGDE
mgnify:CR=1 FL=1